MAIKVTPPIPLTPRVPPVGGGMSLEQYIKQFTRWMMVAVQLGYRLPEPPRDPETGERLDPFVYFMRQVGTQAQTTPVESLPWFREITSGVDPAIFWQRQLGTGFKSDIQRFNEAQRLPREEFPIRPITPPRRAETTETEFESAFLESIRGADLTPAERQFFSTQFAPFLAEFEASPAFQKRVKATRGGLEFLGFPSRLGGITVPKEQRTSLPTFTRTPREEAPTDIFKEFIGQIPFRERFLERAPRQRGFFPSRFAPPTRFLNF